MPSASRKFGRYKGEREAPARGSAVEESEGFRAIMEAWIKIVDFSDIRQLFHDITNPGYYTREFINGRKYSAQDVTKFSMSLGAFQGEEAFPAAGRFLTVLANEGDDNEYFFCLRGITREIELLGFENRKIIEIEGDCGDWLGYQMRSGSITVGGSCGNYAGREMSGGKLALKGNANRCCGERMRGGELIVEGDVEHFLGTFMHNGTIEVRGSAGKCAGGGMRDGKIVIYGDAGDYLGSEETFKGGGGVLQNPVFGWSNPFIDRNPWMPSHMSKDDDWSRLMKGGELIVHGDCGEKVGNGIKGGIIRLEGEYKSLGTGIKGKIYHKGNLVAGVE